MTSPTRQSPRGSISIPPDQIPPTTEPPTTTPTPTTPPASQTYPVPPPATIFRNLSGHASTSVPNFVPPRIESTPSANDPRSRPSRVRRLSTTLLSSRKKSQIPTIDNVLSEATDSSAQMPPTRKPAPARANTTGAPTNLDVPEQLVSRFSVDSDTSRWSDEIQADLHHRQQVLSANNMPVSDANSSNTRLPKHHHWHRRGSNGGRTIFNIGQDNAHSRCRVDPRDGRLRVSLTESGNAGGLARLLGVSARRLSHASQASVADAIDGASRVDPNEENVPKARQAASQVPKPPRLSEASTVVPPKVPRMNIVIMVIGSRGDIQPFLRVGQILRQKHGHRVRIATHPAFKEITEDEYGLEHFSVGGDPAQLMSFMVKNPGMIPTLESVKAGEIGRKRASMEEMFEGFWRACVCPTDDSRDPFDAKLLARREEMPFVADAIIANPPSYAHVHCAEALCIPLHIVFTFPYNPTQAFPHPLVALKRTNVEPGAANLITYPLVDMMVWQGLGDLINDLRVKTLSLDQLSAFWAPAALSRLNLPYTYTWSPGLVPKPSDWGPNVDIAGFVFATNGSNYQPEQSLADFLAASEEPPVYIGFGSIVVDDPQDFTDMIFEATRKVGVRALVSKGWGKLGGDHVPDNIYMLGNIPHDWLFPRVRAAVIHGGAGTTAIALKCALPTMVVPFFGDQNFWGSMIAKSGAGPEAIPYKQLDSDKMAKGIRYLLTDEAKAAATKLAECIAQDGDGAENVVDLFHSHLDLKLDAMRCSMLDGHTAVWATRWGQMRLSPLAAAILVDKKKLAWNRFHLINHHEFKDFYGPGEPITGIIAAVTEGLGRIFVSVVGVPVNMSKTAHKKRREQMEKSRENTKKAVNSDAPRHQNGVPPTVLSQTSCAISRNLENEPMPEDPLGPPGGFSAPEDEYLRALFNGIGISALLLFLFPLFLGNAIAQGFHNAPRLYGDTTVRIQPRVTGFKSGVKATRFEICYGLYDAFTGLVVQPYHGARTHGAKGFAKGVGRGLGGLVLKTLAAVTSPVYAAKGAAREVRRNQLPKAWVRRARIIQSVRELEGLSAQDRGKIEAQVLKDWETMAELFTVITKTQRGKGIEGFMTRKRAAKDIGTILDTAEAAKEALEALKRGESLDDVLAAAGGKSMGWCWKTSYFRACKRQDEKLEEEAAAAAAGMGGKKMGTRFMERVKTGLKR